MAHGAVPTAESTPGTRLRKSMTRAGFRAIFGGGQAGIAAKPRSRGPAADECAPGL